MSEIAVLAVCFQLKQLNRKSSVGAAILLLLLGLLDCSGKFRFFKTEHFLLMPETTPRKCNDRFL